MKKPTSVVRQNSVEMQNRESQRHSEWLALQQMMDDGCPNYQDLPRDIDSIVKAEKKGVTLYQSDVPDEILKSPSKQVTRTSKPGFLETLRRIAALFC